MKREEVVDKKKYDRTKQRRGKDYTQLILN